jgi:hypothetical protein
MVETCSSAYSTSWNFYFWETLKSWFLVVFQSFVFRANFGRFWQFWAEFATLAMVDYMPELWPNFLKPHNFWTVNPKTMCNDFLESYNPSPQVCKVSITSWTYCIQNTLPKSAKSCFGSLRLLQVKSLGRVLYVLHFSFTLMLKHIHLC